MSLDEFENSYFYATDLKAFARSIGISVGRANDGRKTYWFYRSIEG